MPEEIRRKLVAQVKTRHRKDMILPILTYRTLDEAFGRISAAPRPLAAFIFTRSQSVIDRFVGELSVVGGAVNQVNIHLFVETMPFGGVGSAGMGHYYGKYGFDMLTHAKACVVIVHGRFSGIGLPVNWITADIIVSLRCRCVTKRIQSDSGLADVGVWHGNFSWILCRIIFKLPVLLTFNNGPKLLLSFYFASSVIEIRNAHDLYWAK